MHFSIIGTGYIMPRHAEAIHHVGGKIVDVVNTSYARKGRLRAIMEHAEMDAVVILTPNHLHVRMARLAAECGKIVLCEKPLGISSASVRELQGLPDVYTVLQLRHHPLVTALREQAANEQAVDAVLEIVVYRDESYFRTWKGDPHRSGGLLFNIGIHYFDLFQHVFGPPDAVRTDTLDDREAKGEMWNGRYRCRWRLAIRTDRTGPSRRSFVVNGRSYDFSSRDNLSYEDLHRLVYRDLLQGRGIRPADALPSVALVERLHAAAKKVPA